MKTKSPDRRTGLDRLGPTPQSLGLKQKAFPLVPGSSIRAVVIRELCGPDDDEIARTVSIPPDSSMIFVSRVMRREALRRAVVAYWPLGELDAVQAEQPFDGLDGYSQSTMAQLFHFFEAMNGVDDDDVKKAVAAAIEWQPGDGAPIFLAAADSEPSTGSE